MGCVYVVTNTVTGMQYVGKTRRGCRQRWEEHCYHALTSRNMCPLLETAITEYGRAQFSIKVLEQASSPGTLRRREKHWIQELGTLAPNGYNILAGGDKPRRKKLSTEERKARQREYNRRYHAKRKASLNRSQL